MGKTDFKCRHCGQYTSGNPCNNCGCDVQSPVGKDFVLVSEYTINGEVTETYVNEKTFEIVRVNKYLCPDDEELWDVLGVAKEGIYSKIREGGRYADEQIEKMIAEDEEPYRKVIRELIKEIARQNEER